MSVLTYLRKWQTRKAVLDAMPQRRAIARVLNDQGEEITLECGHKLQLKRHVISVFPCEGCQHGDPVDVEQP